MSVLDKSIALVAKYRELIAEAELEPASPSEIKKANKLWDKITASLDEIPPGYEELPTGKLGVRGFAFPFRKKKVVFGDKLPEYSKAALVRELNAWDLNGGGLIETEAAIENLIYREEGNLTEPIRWLFDRILDPIEASPEHPVIYIDLETTGSHPAVSEIIEAGAIVDYGTHEKEYSELYGLRDERAIVNGRLPFDDCHHITPEMIEGKPLWGEASEIHKILADPSVTVVAHNLEFEARWFAHTVPDFMRIRSPYFAPEAGGPDQPRMFDSRFAAAFVSEAESGTLQALVEVTGAEYIDAHRALSDARMMRTALKKL